MEAFELNLANWESSLVKSLPEAGLFSRSEIAYTWKVMSRCWILRETLLWRFIDLIRQSYELHNQEHALGARILSRSALEALAILIYLNQQFPKVLSNVLDFHEFSDKTNKLLLGSKNRSTNYDSINIITVLGRCETKYEGIQKIYSSLSESAHPNSEGLLTGYSSIDHIEQETNFSNRWSELHGSQHIGLLEILMDIFEDEYNNIWTKGIDDLERWVVENNSLLEATKDG